MVSRARMKRREQECGRKRRIYNVHEARAEAVRLSAVEGLRIHSYLCPFSNPQNPHWHNGREHRQDVYTLSRNGGRL